MTDGVYDREWDILIHMRNNLTDPEARGTDTTDTFTGDGIETNFVLTNTLVKNVSEVRVGATTYYRGYDYLVTYGEGTGTTTVTFLVAPTGSIEVDYHYGTTFIAMEVARQDSGMPRCILMQITANEEFLGLGEDHGSGKKASVLLLVHRFEVRGEYAGQVKSIVNQAWNIVSGMRHERIYHLRMIQAADLTNFDYDPELKLYKQQFTIRSEWIHIFKD